ncbi:collagen, type I, alpha 1a-like [Aphelocoma coerulescens]|uniref:collagen, type I, alpha 1a-like n=1 Tax=Aphelocoma coerulescens TaxID=39617 RepID=UPI0036050D54
MPSFGGGPGARARPGLRTEGWRGARAPDRRGHQIPPGLDRETTHAHGRRGDSQSAAASPRSRRSPATRNAQDARGDTAPPAPPRGTAPAGKAKCLASRAPPPAPEAGAAGNRVGIASTRGLPDGKTHRHRDRPPGTAAAASHLRSPFCGHAPGRRRKRPRGRPHPFGPTRGREGRRGSDGQGPGRDRRRRQRAPSGRPSPRGTLAERRRHRPARGHPHSPASSDGGTAEHSTWAGKAVERGRPATGATGASKERRPSRGEARQRQARRHTRACGGGQRRAQAGPGSRTAPQPRKGGEHAPSATVARFEASGPAPAADRANTVPLPRPGRREGGAGRPSPARLPARAQRRSHDDDEHGRPRRSPPQGGSAGDAPYPLADGTAPPPGTRRRRRPPPTAGRTEPPESLNLRPAPRPYSPQRLTTPRGSEAAEARSARYLALGRGKRPGWPRGVARHCTQEDHRGSGRPASAGLRPGTKRASLTPAERPRVTTATRNATAATTRPPRQRVHACTDPGHATRNARPPGAHLLRAGPLGRERDFCQAAKTRPGAGKGRRSRLPRPPKASAPPLCPRPLRHRSPVRRPPSDGDEGMGASAPPGGAVPSTPPSRTQAALAHREEPGSGGLGPRAHAGAHAGEHQRPAFGGAGRGGEARRPAAPPLSGGDGPAADRRGGEAEPPRRRRAHRALMPGRDAQWHAPFRESASRPSHARHAGRGTRLGLTRPRGRPARRPVAGDRPPARLSRRRGLARSESPPTRPPPPGHAEKHRMC